MLTHLQHCLIRQHQSLYDAFARLDAFPASPCLFVLNEQSELVGSITDGDLRRGITAEALLDDPVSKVMHAPCDYLQQRNIDLYAVREKRRKGLKMLPIVDDRMRVIDVLNFSEQRSMLPVDAVIMAGGKGTRLLPLTQHTPKPLLPVDGKPIIAYGIDRMKLYGITNIHITVNYLKDQLIAFAQQHVSKTQRISWVEERMPLGTIGSLSLIGQWESDYILLTSADLLTTIDYEDFFLSFLESEADMMVVSTPYSVKVPYAVLKTKNQRVVALEEKPEYTYHTSTGMYLLKRKLLSMIPKDTFYNATDLMEKLLKQNCHLAYYPLLAYWLDIGKHDDYKKAQKDVKNLDL